MQKYFGQNVLLDHYHTCLKMWKINFFQHILRTGAMDKKANKRIKTFWSKYLIKRFWDIHFCATENRFKDLSNDVRPYYFPTGVLYTWLEVTVLQYLCYNNFIDIILAFQTKMYHRGEFLSLRVPGLAEGRPSLLIGDRVILSVAEKSILAPSYEGIVHEVFVQLSLTC